MTTLLFWLSVIGGCALVAYLISRFVIDVLNDLRARQEGRRLIRPNVRRP
jgi:hypothetical protein